MKLQTPVTYLPNKVSISYKDKILMLGSCFSDNIGTRLKNYGFDVCVNPFGTLYNPASILSSVKRLLECKGFCSIRHSHAPRRRNSWKTHRPA